MRSFRFKMRRTRKSQKNGQQIYNTLNDTGLAKRYEHRSPRFDSRCKLSQNGGARGCTNVGCGPDCCLMLFLLTDLSGSTWDKLNNGMVFSKKVDIYTSTSYIGQIEDVIYPYADCCAVAGTPAEEQEDKFPTTIRLVVSPSSGTCSQNLWRPGMSIGFGGPAGPSASTLTSTEAMIEKEPPVKMGTSNIGAPYRNPIAGFRKTLICCDPGTISCNECVLVYILPDYSGPGPAIGDDVKDGGTLVGQVIGVVNQGGGGEITVRPTGDCVSEGAVQKHIIFGGTSQSVTSITTKTVNTDCVKLPPTNDVYKDSIASSCQIDKRACYDPRIRSGMQPKQQYCIQYSEKAPFQKHKKLLCPINIGWQKAYSFSYSQYNKNRALNTYERGLEKNIPVQGESSSACPSGCRNTLYPNETCCLKSLYRKSGGDACLNCNVTEGNIQTSSLTLEQQAQGQIKRMSRNAITIWKPNNNKFKVQGSVSSGSRMERLKLDTIRAANSKCKKGERCSKDGNGNGPYLAGRPRFTGWPYTARHRETLCMNKYRQQPLGIAQLTNRRRAVRSNRIPGAQPNTRRGGNLFPRRWVNPRAPGCHCPSTVAECQSPCLIACGAGQESVNPSAICCP